MKVAIIVLSYNSAKDLPECLKSIQNSKLKIPNSKIFVVDNNSSDDSVEVAKRFNVEIIKNQENLGFSGGNNIGIKKSLKDGADFILILNPDTKVDPNLISELLKVAKNDEKIGILAPKIYFYPGFEFQKGRYSQDDFGKVIWYAGGVVDWRNVLASHRGVDEVDHGQYDEVAETEFATGATMLIRSEVFSKIGFLDERFFLYLEDLEFCVRAKKAGFKIFYVSDSTCWHKWAQSAGGGSKLQDYYFTRNRLLFGLKYAKLRAKLALFRESIKFLFGKDPVKRKAVLDFYLRNFGRHD